MEISGIRSAFPFLFQNNDRGANVDNIPAAGDIVDIHAPNILADDEVEGVYNDTLNMISGDHAAALSVHGGLSESRVFALLGA